MIMRVPIRTVWKTISNQKRLTGNKTKMKKLKEKSKIEKEPNLVETIQPDSSWGSGDFSHKEVCPICGNDFVHLTSLKCLRETDETTVTSDGILRKKASNDMRGVKITIQYSGECNHAWEVIRQFYKGKTYLKCNILPEEEASRPDIWRD